MAAKGVGAQNALGAHQTFAQKSNRFVCSNYGDLKQKKRKFLTDVDTFL